MRRMQELLDSIATQLLAAIDCSQVTNRPGSAVSNSRHNEIVTSEKKQRLLESYIQDTQRSNSERGVSIDIEEPLSQLKNHLRGLLKDFIDLQTDTIGYALPTCGPELGRRTYSTLQPNYLSCIHSVSSLDSFARGLVKGATVIGVDKVTRLLSEWLKGQPVTYRTSSIINGWSTNEPLTLADGIYVDPLPFSTDKLSSSLPNRRDVSSEDYLGRTVVSIDCSVSPALFCPHTEQSKTQIQALSSSSIYFNTIFLALALECNSHVESGFYWNDYQDLKSFFFYKWNDSWSVGSEHFKPRTVTNSTLTKHATGVTTLTLHSQSNLNVSETQIRSTLRALTEMDSSAIQVAASRWMKSKNTYKPLADKFIDLRIALEALYLRDFINEHSQEMRFRLSLFGAWHLGVDYNERKDIRKKLRKAYDVASKAVHTGSIGDSSRILFFKNQKLLSDAQDLCRRGILKLIQEDFPSDWGALVLGFESDANPT